MSEFNKDCLLSRTDIFPSKVPLYAINCTVVSSYSFTPLNINKIMTSFIIDRIKANINRLPKKLLMVDGTTCVGTDIINTLYNWDQSDISKTNELEIIGFEIDKLNYDSSVDNIKLFQYNDRATVNFTSFLNLLNTDKLVSQPINIIYLDAPWGGKDYKKEAKVNCLMDNKNVFDIAYDTLLSKKPRFKDLFLFILKLPFNYDDGYETVRLIQEKYKVHPIQKHRNIVYIYIEKLKSSNINFDDVFETKIEEKKDISPFEEPKAIEKIIKAKNFIVPKQDIKKFQNNNSTWTITFGEVIENHAGMQKIGELSKQGFDIKDLEKAKKYSEEKGYKTEWLELNNALPENVRKNSDRAVLLIIRNGIHMLLNSSDNDFNSFMQEVFSTENIVDKKAFMKGRVVNKLARWNLCYGEEAQEPDYENKKGRVISFSQTPFLNKIRSQLPNLVGDKGKGLLAELNYYYDISKCYIGWHGDTERALVIGLRLGADFDLKYQWYQNSEPVGEVIKTILHNGDMYIMSSKAVGTDWKKRKIFTLRHSAGKEQ
jgi:hypothetical protein